MAFLIPDNIASRSDVPEALQAVARVLRDAVEDDVTVWYEEGEPACLLVLDPAAGLVFIQASRASGREAARGGGLVNWMRQKKPTFSPERSLQGIAEEYRAKLKAERGLRAPIEAVALLALPNMTRASAIKAGTSATELASVLFEDDFEGDNIRNALSRVISHERARLTDVEERVVRAVVKPDIVINDRRNRGVAKSQLVFQMPDDEDLIRVLDRQQERLAHHLGPGYRVIRGVAGSGKTLVLTFRVRYLAKNFPRQRFLLTCFNVVLSKALEEQVKDFLNVDVCTIDALAYKYARTSYQKNTPNDWRLARESAAQRLRNDPRLDHYDAVFVDEAQDLDTAGLDLAYAALKKGSDNFVIALDGAQNVYRKNARWNPPGTTAQGRTTVLRKSYRNTKEIAGFAWRFLQDARLAVVSGSDPDDPGLNDPTVLVPPELTERHGPEPTVVQCASASAEIEEIVRRIEAAHKSGTPWGQIAVLYGNEQRWQGLLWRQLTGKGIPYFWVSRQKRREAIAAGDVVRASTFQAMKGVEFSRIFMCAVNDIYEPAGNDDPTKFKLAYVGMTRAMDELVITVSGKGPVGQAIQEAKDSDQQPMPLPPATTVSTPQRAVRRSTIGPSQIGVRVPRGDQTRVPRGPGFTPFERAVAKGSPIPEEYSRAHPFLLEAERLEKSGASQEAIQEVLVEAKKADDEAYRYYISRKAIQRQMRDGR